MKRGDEIPFHFAKMLTFKKLDLQEGALRRCTRKPIPPESRYLGTEITDRKLVYDQGSRYLSTEITGNLQNTTSNFSI